MHKFTTTAKVWISEYCTRDGAGLQEIDDIGALTLTTQRSDWRDMGYTLVGEADVTVMIASPDQITNNKVASLRAELEKDRAESQRRQNQLVDKINKLEALTYSETP